MMINEVYKWKKRSERDYAAVPFNVQQAIPIRKYTMMEYLK